MRHDLARYRWRRWGFVWDAVLEPQPAIAATAETAAAPPVEVHYHLHLPPGTDPGALSLALPPGSAVTTEEEE